MAHGETGSSASNANPEASATAEGKSPTEWYRYWRKELTAAEKRLRRFTKQGNKVIERYLDDRGTTGDTDHYDGYRGDSPNRINLFHTNVATLQAMLYGSTPKVEVSREHQDPDDDIARVAALLYQRILQADVRPSGNDYATILRAALQDRLLPGLGVARVLYCAEFEKTKAIVVDITSGEEVEKETEELVSEMAKIGYVHWQDFQWGWARTWAEVPWVGFRSWMSKEETQERFGEKKSGELTYKAQIPAGDLQAEASIDPDQKNSVQKAEVWEFWHKFEKQVFWWSDGVELILDVEDDPLELEGFFPMPKPLLANTTTTLMTPKADFVIAQDLYNEVDTLQSRISTITRACKVVGVYDESSKGIGRMLKEGVENDLIPVDNWAMFAESGGLKGQIDWFPIDKIASVLTILRSLLGETIELLYQVTGMSDILRGANTDQYTSDGTNQLKAKFGSIRVQSLQDEFARFASDLDELKAEIISKHYSPETIIKQANAQFLPEADKDKVGPALQLMQNPDIKWRVDIRPESIAMVDYAQLKSERTEYLTAIATYLQSAGTMIQTVPQALPVLLEMMKWGMAGFKGAGYMEGMLDQAIDQAKKQPPPGQDDGKQKEQEAKQQGELAKIQAKMQADMQVIQAKGQQELQKIQSDSQANMREFQAKMQADLQKIGTDLQADIRVITIKLGADLQVEQAQAAYNIEEQEEKHENTMEEIEAHGKVAARQENRGDDTD